MNDPRRFWHWLPVDAGRLALWHRPGRKALARLATDGGVRVVTLLAEREGARSVGAALQELGMAWTWLPLASGRPPQGRQNAPILAALPALSQALDGGESLFVHCSAGMHRTGMIAYALLRLRGESAEATLAAIGELRADTRAALGREHLDWGEWAAEQARAAL
jgi:hypothetical protein